MNKVNDTVNRTHPFYDYTYYDVFAVNSIFTVIGNSLPEC